MHLHIKSPNRNMDVLSRSGEMAHQGENKVKLAENRCAYMKEEATKIKVDKELKQWKFKIDAAEAKEAAVYNKLRNIEKLRQQLNNEETVLLKERKLTTAALATTTERVAMVNSAKNPNGKPKNGTTIIKRNIGHVGRPIKTNNGSNNNNTHTDLVKFHLPSKELTTSHHLGIKQNKDQIKSLAKEDVRQLRTIPPKLSNFSDSSESSSQSSEVCNGTLV